MATKSSFLLVCSRDPSAHLKGALLPTNEKHLASITDPKQLGELLRAIDAYSGSHTARTALRLAPLVFVRPTELRAAEWSEFQLDAQEWRIPPQRMKMRVPHIVPLSTQAVDLLRDIQPTTGNGKYVFPSPRSRTRPLSNVALLAALRRMGYEQSTLSVHGFRSTASTLLNEQGWRADAIEGQLAHGERDHVRAVYNHAEYLPERKLMMQAWADYLDILRWPGRSGSLPSPGTASDSNSPSGSRAKTHFDPLRHPCRNWRSNTDPIFASILETILSWRLRRRRASRRPTSTIR